MNDIQFTVLSYYPSIVNDENINVGLLFNNINTQQRFFYVTKNLKRLESFDDELDLKFMVAYLNGMKEDWESNLFGSGVNTSVQDFIYNYNNELRFGEIQNVKVDNSESFIEETIKMNFRFDYDVKDRPNEESIKRYLKNLLKSNEIKYSSQIVKGVFEENINYDFVVKGYGFKSFVMDEGYDLKRQINNLKGWAFTAEMNKEIKTVFVIGSDRSDSMYKIALRILESHAKVLKPNEVVPFVQMVTSA